MKMKQYILLLLTCPLVFLVGCKQSQENKDILKPLGSEMTKKYKLVDDSYALLAEIEDHEIFWKDDGNSYCFIINYKGEADTIKVESWLPYAPLTCMMEDSMHVRLLLGVDGPQITLSDLVENPMFWENHEITVYGCPYDENELMSFDVSIPASMAGKEEGTISASVFMHVDMDEKDLAPHIYQAIADNDCYPKGKPTSAFDAVSQASISLFQESPDGSYMGTFEQYCVPVWYDKKSEAVTLLYYNFYRPGMGYNFNAFYETTMPGKKDPLSFNDIFKPESKQAVEELFDEELKKMAEDDGFCFALARMGIAVSIRYNDSDGVPPLQLLPYKDVWQLLKPEIRKIVERK